MAVFGVITLHKDVHSNHIQAVTTSMHNVWIHFVKGSLEDACGKVRKLIKQCKELGIQMEWQLSGRRIVMVCQNRSTVLAVALDSMTRRSQHDG